LHLLQLQLLLLMQLRLHLHLLLLLLLRRLVLLLCPVAPRQRGVVDCGPSLLSRNALLNPSVLNLATPASIGQELPETNRIWAKNMFRIFRASLLD
jgi:hypothetical protein